LRLIVRFALGLPILIFAGATTLAQDPASAASSGQTGAHQKIHNPFSGLIVLPIANNFEFSPGPEHALRYTMDLQPLVPFSLNKDWLVVAQLDLPIITQRFPESEDTRFGLGDTTLTFFFSPQNVSSTWLWGAGPVLQIPATSDVLGTRKWGAGPSLAVIGQDGGLTLGLVIDHIWSFAGPGAADVSTSSIDPSVVYSWNNGINVKAESESSYDWEAAHWTVPLELGASKLVRGKTPVNLGADFLYYVSRVPTDPRWGIRFTVTFVFKE
jgi:hypothetical protein